MAETVKMDANEADAGNAVPLGKPLKAGDLGSLGPYRVIRAIGKGGMGVVYLGVDPKLRRKVALKVMLPKSMQRATARERFLREARALAAVKNDHVVTIYQVDESNGVPYIALEYLQGSTLEDFLRAGQKLTKPQLIHVAREIAVGLAAAHEHGVIHRDVKPENIWLEAPDGRVKLIDFGLARMPQKADNNTLDGTVLGTPAYMSPEQARGQDLDFRSDLFSLGSVIYRLVAGEPPFKGETAFGVVLSLTNDTHVALSEKVTSVPEGLSKLVDSLLAKTPNDRPKSAKDVAKELKRIESLARHPEQSIETRPHTALNIEATENAWAGLETESPSATPSQSTRIAPKNRQWILWGWILGSLLTAALIVGITFMIINRSKPATGAAEPVKPKAKPEPSAPPDPYTPIFNGKDLAGWQPAKDRTAARWSVENGLLTGKESGGPDELLLTATEYGPFELLLEYRWVGSGGDSGVVMFLNEHAMPIGIEVQLAEDSGTRNSLRGRHGTLGPRAPGAQNSRPAGEWNELRIKSAKGHVTVEENGKVINDMDFSNLRERPFRERNPGLLEGKGRIALQIKSGTVEFRNLRIKTD